MKHLFNQVYLDNDTMNYVVYERIISKRGKNTGSEKFTNPSYFTTVRTLKKYLLEIYSIQNITNMEMEQFFKQLERIMRIINIEMEVMK